MHANCYFSINLKGESSQEERRGREENGKREGKGSSKCSLLLLDFSKKKKKIHGRE
jgi:predicted transposase YbfD/YdcC